MLVCDGPEAKALLAGIFGTLWAFGQRPNQKT
jgi:hypothetical protein